MEEAKHTAPWSWDGEYPIVIRDAEGYSVCSLMPSGEGVVPLLIASPDLLQAAEQFVAAAKDGNADVLTGYFAEIFGAAIAKATALPA